MASSDVFGVWVMEEEDTALGREKWGERKGRGKKKKEKKKKEKTSNFG